MFGGQGQADSPQRIRYAVVSQFGRDGALAPSALLNGATNGVIDTKGFVPLDGAGGDAAARRNSTAALLFHQMTQHANRSFNGRAPGMTAVEPHKIPKITRRRKQRPRRDADARFARLFEKFQRIRFARQFAPK